MSKVRSKDTIVKTVRGSTTPTVRHDVGLLAGNASVMSTEEMSQVIESVPSIEIFESTFFDAFDLIATPTYNFSTVDERLVGGGAGDVRTIARYVTLSWRPAPRSFISTELQTKGTKSIDSIKTALVFGRLGAKTEKIDAADISLARTSLANGFLLPGSVRARIEHPETTSPISTFDEELHLMSPRTVGQKASDLKANSFHTSTRDLVPVETMRKGQSSQKQLFKATFVDPGMAATFTEPRVAAATDPMHLLSISSLAHVAASSEVISAFNQIQTHRTNAPEFPAPGDMLGVQYIGYLIERYIVSDDGTRLDTSVEIDDIKTRSWIDRDVLFGVTYTYRIRTIVRWTRESSKGFKKGQIRKSSSRYVSSFYAGDWSQWISTVVHDEVPAPPEEIFINQIGQSLRVVWKIPWDKHRDIKILRLYRSLRSLDERTTEWEMLIELPFANGAYVDSKLQSSFELQDSEYVYTMTSVTVHGTESAMSEQIACSLVRDGSVLIPNKMISLAGVSLDAIGQLSIIPAARDRSRIRARGTVALTLRDGKSSFPLFQETYVLRVTSTATGESTDVPVSVLTKDVIEGEHTIPRQTAK